jgi:hypothetical protein
MCAYYDDPGSPNDDECAFPIFRVGIGSLVGRTPRFIAEVVACVQRVIGIHIPLHAWGVKLKTFQAGIDLPGVVSCDTGAWGNLFYHEHESRRASGLTVTDYSWQISYPRYKDKFQRAQQQARQMSLFSAAPFHLSTRFPLLAPDSFMDL